MTPRGKSERVSAIPPGTLMTTLYRVSIPGRVRLRSKRGRTEQTSAAWRWSVQRHSERAPEAISQMSALRNKAAEALLKAMVCSDDLNVVDSLDAVALSEFCRGTGIPD